jgi:hypothetical protein
MPSQEFINLRSITEAEFLNEIQTKALKVLRVFLLPIHSQHYSFALRFLFLQSQTHATSYSFYSSVTVDCKTKGGKPDRKPYRTPFPMV